MLKYTYGEVNVLIKQQDYRCLDWGNIKSGGSIGMLSKTIITKGKRNYYVKISAYNKHHGVYGIESISELIASRLAKIMKVSCIDMELIDALITKDGNTFRTYLCESPDYKKPGENVVPFEDDYELNSNEGETPLEYVKRIGITESIYSMFIFDYIIANLDRHGANIELYEGILVMAPLFDNGNSLYATRDEKEVIQPNFYMGDDNMGNNYVGSRSLLDNIKAIDKVIEMGKLTKEHRAVLFKDLGKVISRKRRDAIWNLITRRYINARKICNFKEI